MGFATVLRDAQLLFCGTVISLGDRIASFDVFP